MMSPLEVAQATNNAAIISLISAALANRVRNKALEKGLCLSPMRNPWKTTKIVPTNEQKTKRERGMLGNSREEAREAKRLRKEEEKRAIDKERKRRKDIEELDSEEISYITKMVAGKSISQVSKMMARGAILAGMWTGVLSKLEPENEAAELESLLLTQQERLSEVQQMIANLKLQEDAIALSIKETKQKLKEKLPKETRQVIQLLSEAEIKRRNLLVNKIESDTLLNEQDIGFFLNTLGMVRNIKKISTLLEPDKFEDMTLNTATTILFESVPLGDRLDLKFGLDMISHKEYPPYHEHKAKCPICGNSVSAVVEEYQLDLTDEEISAASLTSTGLPYLEPVDLTRHLQVRAVKAAKCSSNLKAIYNSHQQYIAPTLDNETSNKID